MLADLEGLTLHKFFIILAPDCYLVTFIVGRDTVMVKEKLIGTLILILALLLLLYFTWGLVLLQVFPALSTWVDSIFPPPGILNSIFKPDPLMLVIIPVYLAVVLIGVIAMWIGWTMITTPAPEPLDDFDFEEKPESTPKEGEQKTQ